MPETRHEVVLITGASAGIGRAAVQQFARRGARIALIARDTARLEAARAEAERLGAAHAIAISADMADHAQVEAAAERAERELGPIDIWVNNAMATVFAPFADIAPDDFRREWCKTTLTHHPKPIGTYFQPEVAARAIWWAAHARRAEICVGAPTLSTVLAEKFVPRLLDLYLARKGVSGQQGPQSIPSDRPNNLWHPVPGPYAAHGTFDEGASTRSLQLWATTHRTWLLAGVGAATLALGLRQWRRH